MDFGKTLFKKIKTIPKYKEGVHCVLVLQMFSEGKKMSDFCIEAGVSRQRVTWWQRKYPLFNESVQIAKEVGLKKWLALGEENCENKDFSLKIWEAIGRKHFGSVDKVIISVDKESTPMDQYKQLLDQAAAGDFTSSEFKQIMESINTAIRANEACVLQKEINELKEGLVQMEQRELEYQISNQSIAEKDKATLDSAVCE